MTRTEESSTIKETLDRIWNEGYIREPLRKAKWTYKDLLKSWRHPSEDA